MSTVRRIALCDVDAVIVRESTDGPWRTVTERMTPRQARQLADELVLAAEYLEAKLKEAQP
jgi:isocitrate/isopropylmalate dehydrogenase